MHYYLTLTSKCNLQCKYCYGKTTEDFLTEEEKKEYDLDLPAEMNFSINQLKKFSKNDPNFQLTFYGGEPLMRIKKIIEVMDNIPAKTFMLQTNGQFLHKLPSKYVNKIDTILCSIDGTEEHTDERRGKTVFSNVIKNIKLIKENGFKGHIIARMTVDETSDINKNVKFLLENHYDLFDGIHWQLDAQFWRADYYERDFKKWTITKYNPKIKELINWWLNEMKTKKKVHLIYPFVGIIETLFSEEKIPLRCGSGSSVLGIQTNGKVVACPITAGYKPFVMGDIRTSNLKEIKDNKILPENTCLSCEIKDICGGRCLYANKTKLWGEKGFLEVCDTIFFLVNSLKLAKIEIDELIKKGIIKREDFNYTKYNGVEIIP